MTPPIPDFDEAAHRYTHAGAEYASVTRVLEGVGASPPYAPDRWQKAFGTAVHKAAELAIWGKLDFERTSPEIIPAINGLMEKVEEMKIRPIATEVRGVHLLECYAGTTDLVCSVFDADLAYIDYKSGHPARCVELQTAGYVELGVFMESMKDKPLFTRGRMPRRFSMQLTPNRAIVRECKDPFDYSAFIGAVRLYRWMKERRKH